jgi:integrase
VLDAAKAKGLRTGENPARWRGHLSTLLSKRRKLTRGHHPAMPYGEVPAFLGDLRRRKAMSALVLEFIILTAARASEATGARWDEIDMNAKVWTVPADRIKATREHRVPLSEPAMAVLRKVGQVRTGALVFPGQKLNQPLSLTSLDNLMRRMKRDDVTTHGFRSSFRDWVGETTSFPRELAEMALAHTVGDETELAYRRGDALAKRRKLMEAWAGYVDQGQKGGKVVALASRRP